MSDKLQLHHFLTPPRPKLDWNDHTEEPSINAKIWLDDGKSKYSFIYIKDDNLPLREGDKWIYYTDKLAFDFRHKKWKDHQVKFHNFKKHVYKSTITEFSRKVEDKTIAVCFWSDTGETVVSIINDQNEIIFEMSATEIHLEEFEMVLKNRGIKL